MYRDVADRRWRKLIEFVPIHSNTTIIISCVPTPFQYYKNVFFSISNDCISRFPVQSSLQITILNFNHNYLYPENIIYKNIDSVQASLTLLPTNYIDLNLILRKYLLLHSTASTYYNKLQNGDAHYVTRLNNRFMLMT